MATPTTLPSAPDGSSAAHPGGTGGRVGPLDADVTAPTGLLPASNWVRRFAVDRHSVLERQVPMAITYVICQLWLAVPGVTVTDWNAVVLGGVVMAAASFAAVGFRRLSADDGAVPRLLLMSIPLLDILACGFLRAGTGGPVSVFTALLILPVLSLGVEPGRLPLLLGGVVTLVSMSLPLAYDGWASLEDGQWVRLILTPVILGLTCLSVNELTRRLRSRVAAVQTLRREQEVMTRTAQDRTVEAVAVSRMLRDQRSQLRAVIDSVTEQGIVATDIQGRVEVFNAGAERLLGLAAHDAIGRPLLSLRPPEKDPAVEKAAATLFDELPRDVADGGSRLFDWTFAAADEGDRRLQVTVTGRYGASDEIDGYLFVATDVTVEREQARLKDEFVNLISHELRTPLSSILGYLELLSDEDEEPLTTEQRMYVETIERNANRLLRLVGDLLFTAQVEAGRFQLQESEVDLHVLARAAIGTAEPIAAGRDVRLILCETTEPAVVWGDPVRLGQALDNLISNAVKFTPGGGRVAVTLGVTDELHDEVDDGTQDDGTQSGPYAYVVVSDTGVGIPADEVDKLFGRFFRASTATRNAVPGVGLGLSITRAIATAHDGRIRVASTVGEGTAFTLEVPLRRGPGTAGRD